MATLLLTAAAAEAADTALTFAAKTGIWKDTQTASSATMSTDSASDNCKISWTWTGLVNTAGTYTVTVPIPTEAADVAARERPTVTYTLEAADGSHRIEVDQKRAAGTQFSLGAFPFAAHVPIRLHLTANNYQLGDPALGIEKIWVANQVAPALTGCVPGNIVAPGKCLLVLSANTYMKHGSSEAWYSKYHGQVCAQSMASLLAWGRSKGYALTEAYDGGWIYEGSLAKYDAIIINYEGSKTLSTTQCNLVISYVQAGHALVGIHSATHTEGSSQANTLIARMLGAISAGHPYYNHLYEKDTKPNLSLAVTDLGRTHPSTIGLYERMSVQTGFRDEWYSWKTENDYFNRPNLAPAGNKTEFYRGDALVTDVDGELNLRVKEKIYVEPHAVSWQRNPDRTPASTLDPYTTHRGRVWYTSMGHETTSFPTLPAKLSGHQVDPVRLFSVNLAALGTGTFTVFEHFVGGIEYALSK